MGVGGVGGDVILEGITSMESHLSQAVDNFENGKSVVGCKDDGMRRGCVWRFTAIG